MIVKEEPKNSLSKENENEKSPLNHFEIIKNKKSHKWKNYIEIFIVHISFIIFVFSFFLISMKYFTSEEIDKYKEESNQNHNKKNFVKSIITKERENKARNITLSSDETQKLKIGFLYPTITQFMVYLGESFVNLGNLEVFYLVKSSEVSKSKYDDKIKRLNAYDDFKLIKKIVKEEKIDFLIVHYNTTKSKINMLKLLDVKVIGLYEEDIDCEKEKTTKNYTDLKYLKVFNAFIHTNHDEYFNYKILGLYNNIFIPCTNIANLNKLNNISSNLNIHNIILFGKLNDTKNDILSALISIKLIVKNFKDIKLKIISSDVPSLETTKLINLFKFGNNITFSNINSFNLSYFSSSSLFVFTSLTEEYSPLVNMAKSYSIPCIVSSNETHSNIFKNGVIKIDLSNYKELSNEIIKLLKDTKYYSMMKKRAKLSYDAFQKEIINSFIKLIDVLKYRKKEFQNVREEIENIFWNKENQNSSKFQESKDINVIEDKIAQKIEKNKQILAESKTIENYQKLKENKIKLKY